MTADEHVFELDLTLDEVRRRAHVLAGEEDAYALLYSGLDPEQQEVYEALVRAGVLPRRQAGRDAA